MAGSYIFDTTLAGDTFNRANSGTLGANWTTISGWYPLAIVSDTAQMSTTANDNNTCYTALPSWPNNQWSASVLSALTGADSNCSTIVRASKTANTFYWASWTGPLGSSATVVIAKNIADSFTALTSATTITLTAGDTVMLGVVGTNLYALHNGAVIQTVSDSSITSGFPGLGVASNGQATTASAFINWRGGCF